MLTHCPHCHQALNFSQAQQDKLQKALAGLAPGKQLSIKCPHCRQIIKLEASSQPSASPPPPPELDWLKTGGYTGEEKVEDVPMALVLYPSTKERIRVEKSLKSVGYQVIIADSPQNARTRMQFVNFSCVVLHTELEPGGLPASTFHAFMRDMAMERRRYIYYILIGPGLHSLYDLQALALSANLVVNEQDLDHFDVILRKAIPDYEELFGPLLEELSTYGRR